MRNVIILLCDQFFLVDDCDADCNVSERENFESISLIYNVVYIVQFHLTTIMIYLISILSAHEYESNMVRW